MFYVIKTVCALPREKTVRQWVLLGEKEAKCPLLAEDCERVQRILANWCRSVMISQKFSDYYVTRFLFNNQPAFSHWQAASV